MKKLTRAWIIFFPWIIFFILFNIIIAIIYYYVYQEGFDLKRQLFMSIPSTILYFISINYYIKRKRRRLTTHSK